MGSRFILYNRRWYAAIVHTIASAILRGGEGNGLNKMNNDCS